MTITEIETSLGPTAEVATTSTTTTTKHRELAEASVKRMLPIVSPEKEVSFCRTENGTR
jgi:hypothetical protein